MNKNKWFVIPKPNPNADLKLICFPYAGGNAQTYMQWTTSLIDNIELVIVQPPGRGPRMSESMHSSMDTLITDMLKVIPAHLDKPYILFGHSLGSLVAFELMNQIKQLGYALPKHFIASGSKGPHKNSTKKPIYHLPHDEFIHELEKLNGTPKAILENKELLEFFVPLLKADFEIAHTYSYLDKAKFNCPITVLGGENDTIAPPSSLRSWGDFFTVPAKISILFGDHFFINSHKEMVIKKINKIIDNTLIALPQEKA